MVWRVGWMTRQGMVVSAPCKVFTGDTIGWLAVIAFGGVSGLPGLRPSHDAGRRSLE